MHSCGEPSKTSSVSLGIPLEMEERCFVDVFCDFGDDVTSSRLRGFSHCLTAVSIEGMVFVSLGLKKERRLPCGFEEVFTVLVFFPFGATESDVNNRFLLQMFPSANGFKFSLFSSFS